MRVSNISVDNNIAIIDADLIRRKNHRFPNLVSMKLSAYYKNNGCNITHKVDYDNLDDFDKVFISKVFTDTTVPNNILSMPNVEYGGTGFYYDQAPPLPFEIEHTKPDYDFYTEWINSQISKGYNIKQFEYYLKHSIGFTTRGCIRQCAFCVNKNYKQCNLHSSVSEFIDDSRPYICLLDDNIFACKDWKKVFDELNNTQKRFQFKQGMDERLLTPEKCEVLFKKSNWIGDFTFSFDNIKDEKIIEEKLKLIREYLPSNKAPKFYLFCGFNHDNPDKYSNEFWQHDIIRLFERIKILFKYSCIPYVMRYKDYELSPFKGTYINLARWCNQPNFVKKLTYEEFCMKHDENSATRRYFKELKITCPEIANKYYNLKF